MSETQEPDRIPTRSLLVIAAITAVTFGVAIAISTYVARTATPAFVAPPRDTLERSLFTSPPHASAARLDRYRWIDRDAGLAEIPIESAIDLTVAEQR